MINLKISRSLINLAKELRKNHFIVERIPLCLPPQLAYSILFLFKVLAIYRVCLLDPRNGELGASASTGLLNVELF